MTALADFAETRLARGYDYGAKGGPIFNTAIVRVHSGHEVRNAAWSAAGGRWEIGARNISRDEADYLIRFFRARRGRAQGFRLKDWSDFTAQDQPFEHGGTDRAQLVKVYTESGEYRRLVAKPVAGSVVVRDSAGAVQAQTTDTTTGVVTLSPALTGHVAQTGALDPLEFLLNSGPAPAAGANVYLYGPGIEAYIGAGAYTVVSSGADRFRIDYDKSGGGGYDFTGDSKRLGYFGVYPPAGALTVSFEFDVPARFDSDRFDVEFMAYDEDTGDAVFTLSSLPVVEIKR